MSEQVETPAGDRRTTGSEDMARPLRILMLEDVASDALLVEHELRRAGLAFTSRRVDTGPDFEAELLAATPDLILADFSLPGFDGITALHMARERMPQVPFIFVSGAIGEERAIEVLRTGATDYVLKDRLSRLGPAVRRALAEAEQRLRREQAEEALRRAHAELEQRVQERTAELAEANAQLLKAQDLLEARVAERTAELERANESLRYQAHLLTRVSDAVLATDAELRITLWNRAAEEMYGWKPDDVLGRPVNDVVPFAHGRDALARFRRYLARHGRIHLIQEHPRRDGTPIVVEGSLVGLPDEEGVVTGYLAVLRDITERRRAEEALRESEARFRAIFERAGIGIGMSDPQGHMMESNEALQKMLGYTEAELRTMTFAEYTHPQDLRLDLDNFEELLAGKRDVFQLEKRCIRKDGQVIWVSLIGSLVRDDAGRPLFAVGMLDDITQRKRSERSLSHHSTRLQMLHEIDQSVLSAESIEDIAQAALRQVQQVIPYHCASVVVYDRHHPSAEQIAAHDVYRPEAEVRGRVPIDDYAIPAAHRRGEVHLVDSLEGAASPIPGTCHNADTRTLLSVPLMADDELIGSLNLTATEPRAFTQDHVETARQVADSLAVAIHNARLFQQVQAGRQQLQHLARRLVEMQESERRAIARELHDEAGQSLTSLMVGLGLLERELEPGSALSARIRDLKRTTDGVMEGLHGLAMNLRPVVLDKLGLLPALEQVAESLRRQRGLQVELVDLGVGGSRLPAEIEITLYRIIAEALTNISRHAHATRAGLILEQRSGRIVTIIEDNGVGFVEDEASLRGRLGLLGMRERAEMLGGTLTIESTPGAGTTVFVDVPCTLS